MMVPLARGASAWAGAATPEPMIRTAAAAAIEFRSRARENNDMTIPQWEHGAPIDFDLRRARSSTATRHQLFTEPTLMVRNRSVSHQCIERSNLAGQAWAAPRMIATQLTRNREIPATRPIEGQKALSEGVGRGLGSPRVPA